MEILFLMLHLAEKPLESGMYTDLAEEFRDNGHSVTIMAPDVAKNASNYREEEGFRVLRIKTRQVLEVKNLIKKGLGLALLPFHYKRAYKRFLLKERFDWIIMPTPPITLIDFVSFVKCKTNAKFYLILRDIHPQSAASIGLIKYRLMYNYLARRASKGYDLADYIGCMSQGNIDFIASNYPALNKSKLVLLMNWQKFEKYSHSMIDVREKYNLKDKFIVLFGGNIGLGQRIENIVTLAKHYINDSGIVFLIIGKGVKKDDLENIALKENLHNITFIEFMPRNDYLEFIKSVDLGLISINENYTVPTCPSKAVSYMAIKIPIFAIINPNNDYGKFIENAGAGFYALGNDKEQIFTLFDRIYHDKELRKKMGENGYQYFVRNLTASKAYNNVMDQINNNG